MEVSFVWCSYRPPPPGVREPAPVELLERPIRGGQELRAGIFSAAEVAREGVFWVPVSSLLAETVEWSVTQNGQYVRVPLFAYRTTAARTALLAMGLELGTKALASLVRRTGGAPNNLLVYLSDDVITGQASGSPYFWFCAGLVFGMTCQGVVYEQSE